jgi:hypothetical protein
MKTNIIRTKHLCAHCQQRRAAFATRQNPRYRADVDHDLCPRCFRSHRNALRRWSRENTIDGWMVLRFIRSVSRQLFRRAEEPAMPYGVVRARRDGNRLVIEVSLPESGELSLTGRAENFVDPSVWHDYDDGELSVGIKMTVCRPLIRRGLRRHR